jgi:hypothetical protein
MSRIKDITKKIMLEMGLDGSVYADNFNGTPRVLVEKCEVDENIKLELKKRIREHIEKCEVYI